MFKNREEAGKLLFKELSEYKDKNNVVIVAIPKGGVPVGFEIAKQLNLPLDLVLSKKLGHPANKEYAIGAINLENRVLSDSAKRVSHDYIDSETSKIRAMLKEQFRRYYGKASSIALKDKIAILIDDGVATGSTLISSIELLKQQLPKKIIVAIPVASKSALKRLREYVQIEDIVCLFAPETFHAVGQFYRKFGQVSDAQVITLLQRANTDAVLKV